jgi:dTDP-4-dehydrorhamnose reductase
MKKKKIYIAGCGGMLGEAFYKLFSTDCELMCTDINLSSIWLSPLDFRDLSLYKQSVLEFRPDLLFHLGAYTDLEFCESNPDDAYTTNTLSVENAAYIANQLRIPLLYISTAGIFDGRKEYYDDWDLPCPLGAYARSKYAAEIYVTQNVERHLVCRAGWMMGGGPNKDKKFVQKVMAQIRGGGKELNIVDDRLGTPTYTHDFASNVKTLLDKELWGLYNVVCEGMTSRLEVAREIVEILGLENSIRINPVSSEFFAAEYFAPRPASERLLSKKLNLRGLNSMRDWRVCLREYIRDYYGGYLGNIL